MLVLVKYSDISDKKKNIECQIKRQNKVINKLNDKMSYGKLCI